MKKFLLLLVGMTCASLASAANYMYVKTYDGETVKFQVSNIEEVTFGVEIAGDTTSKDTTVVPVTDSTKTDSVKTDTVPAVVYADSVTGLYVGTSDLNVEGTWADTVLVSKVTDSKVDMKWYISSGSNYLQSLAVSNVTVSHNEDGTYTLGNDASDFLVSAKVLNTSYTSRDQLSISDFKASVDASGNLTMSFSFSFTAFPYPMSFTFTSTGKIDSEN